MSAILHAPRPTTVSLPMRDPVIVVTMWLIGRTLLWTWLALLAPSPPLDTVEWLAWGRQWQAGYHKHPPLAAWIAELASQLTPGSLLGVHLVGYLFVALALWCVWRLASELLPPRGALAAVLCLDGLTYLTRDAAEFNNQVVQVGFSALAVWACWRAVVTDRWRWWVLTGVALGLALWCKYTAVFLALSLGAFWLWHDRRRWSRGVVVAGVAAVVFLPHLLWLIEHHFITLRYAAERVRGESAALDHRWSALTFVASQAARLVPVVGMLVPLWWGATRPARGSEREAASHSAPRPEGMISGLRSPLSERIAVACRFAFPSTGLRVTPSVALTFLLFAVLGPVLMHLVAAIALGTQLRDIWGMSLWPFVGLLALMVCEANATPLPPTPLPLSTEGEGSKCDRAWHHFRLAWSVIAGGLVLVTLASQLGGSAVRERPLRVHYPAALLASEVTAHWHAHSPTPLPLVAGDWWLAGCVCTHSGERPMLYASREPAFVGMDLSKTRRDPAHFYAPDPVVSPWTNDDDFRHRGGVLVWDASVFGDDMPASLQPRFPTARPASVIELPLAGGAARAVRVGCAVVPATLP